MRNRFIIVEGKLKDRCDFEELAINVDKIMIMTKIDMCEEPTQEKLYTLFKPNTKIGKEVQEHNDNIDIVRCYFRNLVMENGEIIIVRSFKKEDIEFEKDDDLINLKEVRSNGWK